MAEIERQQPALRSDEQSRRAGTVLTILQNLRDLDGLKKLFWEELNYERENKPLSPRQWPESAKQALAEDPVLFASGGEENAFHIIYCRLNSPELKHAPSSISFSASIPTPCSYSRTGINPPGTS